MGYFLATMAAYFYSEFELSIAVGWAEEFVHILIRSEYFELKIIRFYKKCGLEFESII